MRPILSILFLLLFSFAFTEVGQFVKMPFVVQHYYSHQNDHNNASLLGFLKHHYWNKHDNDGDQEQDNRLPFKTVISVDVYSFEVLSAVGFASINYRVTRGYNLYKSRSDIAEPLISIFHPPRSIQLAFLPGN